MFLNAIRRRNPNLLEAALRFHAVGKLPPNTFVLDIDAVKANARSLARKAQEVGLDLYFMTKQMNRNPAFMEAVAANGLTEGVAVDIDDARALRKAGITLGHVGHLVQVPTAWLKRVLAWRPAVMTVFDLEKAKQVSEAAVSLGMRQPVLIRLAGQEVFPGQEGGVALETLGDVAKAMANLPGVEVAGVTAFPCLVAEEGRAVPTANLDLLVAGARVLREEAGLNVRQVNGPALTCCSTLELLRQAGVTHAEPGHALTGTTPLHAVSDQPEVPAVIYLSEISHTSGDTAYCYGGGTYVRGRMRGALVGHSMRPAAVRRPSAEHIDYYLTLENCPAQVGEPVLMAFRAQAFTARANMAAVAGISENRPVLVGLYDRANEPLNWDCGGDGQ